MKTIIKKAVMLSVVVLLAAVFCSCGKDEPKVQKPVKTTFTVNCQASGSMLSIATLHIRYTDANGELKEEACADGKINISVEYTTYPFTAKAEYFFVLNAGATIDPDASYNVIGGGDYLFVTKYNTGYEKKITGSSVVLNTSVKGSKLDSFLSRPKIISNTAIGTDGDIMNVEIM